MIAVICEVGVSILVLFVLNLVNSLQGTKITNDEAIYLGLLVGSIILCQLTTSLLLNCLTFMVLRVSIGIKSSVRYMLLKKLLKFNISNANEKFITDGKILNLVSIDSSNFQDNAI